MNICFLMLRIWNHGKFRLTGPSNRKNALCNTGKWTMGMGRNICYFSNLGLFFFQRGNMKHQRETTSGTEYFTVSQTFCDL